MVIGKILIGAIEQVDALVMVLGAAVVLVDATTTRTRPADTATGPGWATPWSPGRPAARSRRRS
ncbi:hypothetical protein [Kocuria kalidii]|uniref:hypothetical protein n=1 Tax=Kocuria kalidii TaxID=3376283 RepID=UPI00378BB5A2